MMNGPDFAEQARAAFEREDSEPSSCNPEAPGFADAVRKHAALDPETMRPWPGMGGGRSREEWERFPGNSVLGREAKRDRRATFAGALLAIVSLGVVAWALHWGLR